MEKKDAFIILLITLIFIEIILRVTKLDENLISTIVDENGKEYLLGLYADGGSYFNSSIYVFNPVLGWKFKPNKTFFIKDRQGESTFHFSTNSDGFRSSTLTNGKQKLMFIGDSFTFSWGENKENAYYYLIGKKLNASISNYGVLSYGTDQELLTLKNYIKKEHPDKVILTMYIGNDFDDNYVIAKEGQCVRKTFFTLNGSQLIHNTENIKNCKDDLIKSIYAFSSINSKFFKLATTLLIKLYANFQEKPNYSEKAEIEKIQLTSAILKEIKKVAMENNAQLYIFSVASEEYVLEQKSDLVTRQVNYIAALKSLSVQENFSFFDCSDLLKEQTKKGLNMYRKFDIHLSKQGNSVLSDCIYSSLSVSS